MAAGAFLLLQVRRDVRFLGVIVSFLVVTFLMVGLNAFHVVANSVHDVDERGFPYMGNVPVIRLDPDALGEHLGW